MKTDILCLSMRDRADGDGQGHHGDGAACQARSDETVERMKAQSGLHGRSSDCVAGRRMSSETVTV
jgi:hypothetical protein